MNDTLRDALKMAAIVFIGLGVFTVLQNVEVPGLVHFPVTMTIIVSVLLERLLTRWAKRV